MKILRNISFIFVALMSSLAVAQNVTANGHSVGARQIRMDSLVHLDPTIDSIVTIYRTEIAELMKRTIGYCDTRLFAKRPDSNLMRFFADAMLSEGQKYASQNGMSLPVIALANTGGLRSNIEAGNVTVSTIFELTPFENSLVFMTLTADQIQRVADHIASRGGEPISGMTLTIDKHIAKASDIIIDGKPLDRKATYIIATNNYIADGGDGFGFFVDIPRFDTGLMLREIIIDYIETLTNTGRHVTAPTNPRISVRP